MSYTSDASVWVPTCALCNSPVELETCKIDERGSAVHEECYVRRMRVNARRVPIPPLALAFFLSPRSGYETV
jgi:hypothetical protein